VIRKPRRWRRWLLLAVVLYAASGVVIGELYLHPPRRPLSRVPGRAVSIRSFDGAWIHGSLLRPAKGNGDVVIALHGIADNRLGVLGHGELFVKHGYMALLPDARGHGASEGTATYGVREVHDLSKWLDWLAKEQYGCIYGFGGSMGGGILLASLAVEDRFCAVAADAPFADLRWAGYDRLSEPLRLPPPWARLLLWAPLEVALLHARYRSGADWSQASPLLAVARSTTPVLLIHGANDRRIRSSHSRALRDAHPQTVTLWEVPGAGHSGAWSVAGAEYERRVIAWFQKWRRLQPAR
jgi:dipeptidyl aminopeptidase/acylaminoacyl peptidase